MASAGEKALHAALKTRTFDPVWYFFGDDDFLKDARLRDLVEAAVDPSTRDFNYEQRRGAELSPDAVDSLLGTPPMLAERRVVVLRDADKLKKDARAVLDRHLARPATDTVLVLVTPSGVKEDKKLGARATVVEFAPLSADRVQKWIAHHASSVHGRTITPEATALLMEAVGVELAMLSLELEKLASFAAGDIDEHAVSEVVGVRRGESLGDFLDAVAAREAGAALALVPHVLQQPKTNAVSVTMALTVQMLAIASGQAARASGLSSPALFNEYMGLLKETGAFPFRPWGDAAKSWARYTDGWTPEALDAALATLLATDEALKDTRLSSDEQVLASLVLALCGHGRTRRAA